MDRGRETDIQSSRGGTVNKRSGRKITSRGEGTTAAKEREEHVSNKEVERV